MNFTRESFPGMNLHHSRFPFDHFIESIARSGYKTFEFWCGSPHFEMDSQGFDPITPIAQKAHDAGLRPVSVTSPSFQRPYQCAAGGGTKTQDSFAYFCNGIRVTAALDCRIMTVNSGWGSANETMEEAWKRSRDMLRRLAEFAQTQDVTLALESLRSDETNLVWNLETTVRMINEVGHPRLCAMVDTIAMGAAGETLQQWFDAFGPRLVHMHFLDGDPFVHLAWGDGNYPLAAMLNTIAANGYKGYLVQEIADDRYLDNPAEADRKSMATLARVLGWGIDGTRKG
jgi:protein FrlC